MRARTLAKALRALEIAAAGGSATLVITAAGGKLAQDKRVVDPAHRLYELCRTRRSPRLTRRLEPVTYLGGYSVIQSFSVLVGGMLARDRRRLAPVALPVAGFVAEVLLQKHLQKIVRGSKPPADWSVGPPGDYPSGGAARMVVTFGLLGHFLNESWPTSSERAVVWATVAALVLAQGGSRVYLGRHWPEDVVGGWLLGALLLATLLGVDRALRSS
jgi:membrane-associated phospholipid phosphatase